MHVCIFYICVSLKQWLLDKKLMFCEFQVVVTLVVVVIIKDWYQNTFMVKTKSKKSTCNYKFTYITIFCFLVCLDLILFALRKRHFNSFYPLIQQLLHTPGSDGTYAQNYQDTWFLRLAEVGLHLYHWP